jgi:NAD(P)H dehydrogenase (quinone)
MTHFNSNLNQAPLMPDVLSVSQRESEFEREVKIPILCFTSQGIRITSCGFTGFLEKDQDVPVRQANGPEVFFAIRHEQEVIGLLRATRLVQTMKISVIIAHPNPASFNHAIAGTVVAVLKENDHQVVFHDLYAERFDPVLPFDEIPRDASLDRVTASHCAEIAGAEGIIVIHPDWWGQPPAILKGWIDRVIRPGVAYRFLEGDNGEGIPEGLLRAGTALVFNTSNTPADREREVFGDPLERLWKDCVFSFCGVPLFQRRMFSVVATSTCEDRCRWLVEVRSMVNDLFPFTPTSS